MVTSWQEPGLKGKNVVLKNIMENKNDYSRQSFKGDDKNTCVRVSLVLTGRDWWGKAWWRSWREQRWTKILNDKMPFTTYRCSSLPSHRCFQAPLFLLFPSSRRTREVSHQAAWKWNWSENLTICVHPDLIFSAVFSTWSLSKLFTRKQTLVEGWSLNSTFR